MSVRPSGAIVTFFGAVVLSLLWSGALIAQQPPTPSKLDPAIFDRYLGTYVFPSGRLLVIARTERSLYAFEPSTRQIRGLERIDDRTCVAGPSLLVYTPETYRLTFVTDPRGRVTGVAYTRPDAPALRAKKAELDREEFVTFRNGTVTLSGTLLLPGTKGPHPAIVLGRSGAQDRNGYVANIRFMADHLARHGVAVLTYDKRGSAPSHVDGSRWRFALYAPSACHRLAVAVEDAHADVGPPLVKLMTEAGAGRELRPLRSSFRHEPPRQAGVDCRVDAAPPQ